MISVSFVYCLGKVIIIYSTSCFEVELTSKKLENMLLNWHIYLLSFYQACGKVCKVEILNGYILCI